MTKVLFQFIVGSIIYLSLFEHNMSVTGLIAALTVVCAWVLIAYRLGD